MVSIAERHNAGGNGRPITEWTSFKESEKRVESYVSEVYSKVSYRNYYKRAGDMLDDYETCTKLLIKLMEERSGFIVALYDKQYFYNYAALIKTKMLCSFSTMFLAIFNRLDQQSVDWLKEEEAAPEVLLSESEDSIAPEDLLSKYENCIKYLDRNLKMMDENQQSDINKLKEGHVYLQSLLHEFQQTQNEIHATLDANKEEVKLADENVHGEKRMKAEDHLLRLNTLYEDVKCTICRARVDMRSLTELGGSCNLSLQGVKEAILMLESEFYRLFRLVRRSEEDLSQKWFAASQYKDKHPLVLREKEKYEKARAYSDMQWEQTRSSSGLIH